MIYRIYTGGQEIFPYKLTVILLLILKYIFEQYINYRQLRMHMIKKMPVEVSKFNISQEQFTRSQDYQFDKLAFEMYVLSLKAALDTIFLLGNLFPRMWEFVGTLWFIDQDSEFQRGLCYVLVEGLKIKTFDVPIDFYKTFVIEKKYASITQQTFFTFWYSQFVNSGLMLIGIPPILYGYLMVVDNSGEYFYLFMEIFVFFIVLIYSWVFPNIFAPFFTKITDMQDPDPHLKSRIKNLANSIDFPLQQIYILHNRMGGSHSNAHFYGVGSNKRIVLYDTLLKNLNTQQILSVVGHQLGHWKYNHAWYKFIYFILEVFCIFYVFSFFRNNDQIFISFGFQEKSTFIGTTLFFSLFEPIQFIFNVVSLVMERYFQFQADEFSCQKGYAKSLLDGLYKIYRESALVIPDPLYAWCKHNHPSIHERVFRIKRYAPDLRSDLGSYSSRRGEREYGRDQGRRWEGSIRSGRSEVSYSGYSYQSERSSNRRQPNYSYSNNSNSNPSFHSNSPYSYPSHPSPHPSSSSISSYGRFI